MSIEKYEETLPVEEMVEKAVKAMERSYSPYSGFKVGACLLTSDGECYTCLLYTSPSPRDCS